MATAAPLAAALRLAPGTELLGAERGSALREAPCLVRRADGEVVQVAPLLYLVARQADGTRDAEEIAARVSDAVGRRVSAANVRYVADRKLRPLGLLLREDGSPPPVQRLNPLLALRFRVRLVPAHAVAAVASPLRLLFLPPVVAAALAALAICDAWLFGIHGVEGGVEQAIDQPALLLGLFAATVLSMFVDELGHAAACRYDGGRPSAIGAGVYLVWPVLYSDVTDSYRFDRAGRLRTDLGGMYFNGLVAIASVAAYGATGFEPLLLVAAAQHVMVLNQFLPWVRLDGYYVVSDLIGVPNLFAHLGPTLRSLLPGRRADARTAALKPRARAAVVAWVLSTVAGLGVLFGWLGANAHAFLAGSAASLARQSAALAGGLATGDALTALAGLVGGLMLLLPPLGLALTFCLICRRLGVAAGRARS